MRGWRSLGLLAFGGVSLLTSACSDPDPDPSGMQSTAGQATVAGTGSGGGSSTGGSAGTGGSSAGMGGTGQLPNGAGVEYRGIVNLVDAAAAKALDDYILEADPFLGGSGQLDLSAPTALFYEHYSDEYDFLFFITDHPLDTSVHGLHGPVNQPPLFGTGNDAPISTGKGPPRLRSAVGIQLASLQSFPPFAHEFAHGFAVHLADELGFGSDVDSAFPAHWGMVSANGQLGGFDATTLGCETPAGAKPPNCTPGVGGRVRYTVAPFLPNSLFSIAQPFGPMELYLMGLLPLAEVPSPLLRFEGADFAFDSLMANAEGKLVIEASGLSEISTAQIVARHGQVPLLTEEQRHFKAAMVLVTAAPAQQVYLDRVADLAAIFGGQMKSAESPSFAELTGGRATLSCHVGMRHDPEQVVDFGAKYYKQCSPQTQDCAQGSACYGTSDFYCAVAGTADAGATCMRDADCKAGFVCGNVPPDFTSRICTPYCDHQNAAAANACATLCPGGFSPLMDLNTSEVLGAFCHAGSGGTCNPLLQDCPAGKACTGMDLTTCEPAGAGKIGEVCLFNGTCEKGSVCIGVEGDAELHCQPYCDSSPTAAAGTDCASKCPNGAWEYPAGYGICIP